MGIMKATHRNCPLRALLTS